MFTSDDFSRIEEELGVVVPIALQEFLLRMDGEEIRSLAFELFTDVEDWIDANARLVVSDAFSHTGLDYEEYDSYFVFGHFGGNYLLLDPDDDKSNVWYFLHDPLEMRDSGASIEEFLSCYG